MLGANGNFRNPGSPQKPQFPPFWASSQSLTGPTLQQYCPCQSVCTFNFSMPIHALSYNPYNYVYILADYSIKEGKFLLCF